MADKARSAAQVYKILRPAEWEGMRHEQVFVGSEDDRRDGFIHLSTSSQVQGTLVRHFAGETNLVILQFETSVLDSALRWETSRGGELFPHFYGSLKLADVAGLSDMAGFLSESPSDR